ncbi:restriction endonuclease subunit S [Vibrio harveyi]|uniref:restriction endonuclease subunit S n=1 Tax=Vibrio harveyi TaxID=669 RepID=UPI000A4D4A88|nr:restriction endonuclease subunit S [Vibrio harveyi]PNM41304.1 restriction endonuclease subunit S [Vibrio harveyi]
MTALSESNKYQAYPEYKDSGVEWLDKVPSHWNMFSGKRVFCSVRRKALSSDEQLAASQKFGVVPQSLMMELNDAKVMLALKGTDSFRHVEKDNFVISLRSFEGGIEHSAYVGCVSPAYTVLEAIKNVSARYYKYLLKSKPYIAALQASTDSLRDGKSISFEQFSNIWLPLFEVGEQAQIANFLDHETAKIDTLIEKQQQLIKLLKEKRQAVISHAVTKGLNPEAPMKDSGVEWLGKVPEHWDVCKLSYRYEVLLGKMLDEKKISGNYLGKYLRNTDVQWDSINTDNLPEMDFRPQERERYSVKKGDLIVCEGGEIGRCGIWESESTCFYQKALHRLRPLYNTDLTRFMFYVLFNAVHQERFISGAGKATIAHLPAETFKQYRFAFPPLDEQQSIIDFLDSIKGKFDLIENKAQLQIELLKERRTALISAAVTGKIDVRNWQAPTHQDQALEQTA